MRRANVWWMATAALAVATACGPSGDGEETRSAARPRAESAVAAPDRSPAPDRSRAPVPPAAGPELLDLPGGWNPPDHALALARRLADPAASQSAAEDFDNLEDDVKADVVRAGLRLPDEQALAAALRAQWRWLDHGESARLVDLLLPRLFDEDEKVDFEEFRSLLGSRELTRVLQLFEEQPPDEDFAWMLGPLHRNVRAEHVPQLAALVGSSSEATAREAWNALADALRYTDAHRDAVAAAVAARLGAGRAPGGTALPAPLLSMLDVLVTREAAADRHSEGYLRYALRWLREADSPASRGNPFLTELRERLGEAGGAHQWVADELAAAIDGAPEESEPWEAWSDDDPAAVASLKSVLLETELSELRRRVRDLEEARWSGRAAWGVRLHAAVFAETDVRNVAPARLAMLGALIPEWRTRAVAERAFEVVTPERLAPVDLDWVLAFLEVADRGRLTSALQAIALAGGDAADIVEDRLESLRPRTGLELLPDTLATELVEQSEGTAEDQVDADVVRTLSAQLSTGDVAGAVRTFLAARPDETRFDLGRVRVPELRLDLIAYLRQLRLARGDGRYHWATGQLALLGDEEAVREIRAAAREGRYRWVDEIDHLALVGGDPTRGDDLAFWAAEAESNCCRFVVVEGVFEEVLGVDVRESAGRRPPRAWLEEYRARWGADLAWSDILGHWVPAVR